MPLPQTELELQETQDELGALRTEVATLRDQGATARRAVEDAEAAQQVGAAPCDCKMMYMLLPSRWGQLQQLSACSLMLVSAYIHSRPWLGMQCQLSRWSHLCWHQC